MKNQTTRRTFLRGAGTLAAAVIASPSILPEKLFAASTEVRRNVGGMSAYDPVITDYRKAVRAMQALPNTNPLSWAYQAAIHGTTLAQNLPAWRSCEHGTYYFWSWHRMYLYWFERIVRKMCGNPCWSLPYWDWTSPAQRQLPVMFRDTSSELYTANRNPAMNSGAGSLPAWDVNYASAFSFPDFTSASSSLEGTPHGAVHVDIGGWMGSVPTAAQDPVFYLHHCNIDRLWDLWLAQGGGRSDPLNDSAWKTRTFTFFNESGTAVTMNSCQVLRAAAQLNYVYEGEPAQVYQNCSQIRWPPIAILRELLMKFPIPPVELGPEPSRLELDMSKIKEPVMRALQSEARLILQFDSIEADVPPGAVWEVHIGTPAGQPLNPESEHFVGNIALFGSGIRSEAHHGKFMPASFSFVVNKAIQQWSRAPEQTLQVAFVPHGVLIDGKPSRPQVKAKVKIGGASLFLATEKK